MKLNILAAAPAALMLAMMATGCSDSDKWTPGPQDTDTGVSAYFVSPSATSYIFGSDAAEIAINVPVERRVTEGEATVGITMTSDVEGFKCPDQVTFADGESSVTVTIDCSGIPDGKVYNVALRLAEDETNIYGEGLNEVRFTAIKADWIEISDNVRYLYSDWDKTALYPATYANMYQLEGTMMFKLTDFFGSGLDITFNCDTPNATVLYPLQNADFENVYDEDKADVGWYLYDQANVNWPIWIPGDVEGYPAIKYLLFYSISDYNVCRMIYNANTLYGYIGLTTGVDFDNGEFIWGNFQVDFNLKYNPFE